MKRLVNPLHKGHITNGVHISLALQDLDLTGLDGFGFCFVRSKSGQLFLHFFLIGNIQRLNQDLCIFRMDIGVEQLTNAVFIS